MFRFFEKMFKGLLSFTRSLATKYMSLNNEQSKTRPAVVNRNPVELKYYLYSIYYYFR